MPTKEFNNVQLDVTFIQAATRSNITSGEDIATSFGKISKWFTDLKSIAWDGHPTVTQKDTTSTVSPNPEETFTVVDSVTRNGEGHVTGINVKTVKLPTGSGYVHPTHDSHTSGLYKITVDELGHVSDATAVTKTDITDLGIPGSDTNTTYTLSGAYGPSSNTWVTTLTPSSGSATTSTVPTASTTVYGITKLSSATNSTSTSLAATASAVKAAYDKANHSHPYLPLTGGTISSSSYGPLTIERTGSTSAAAIVFKNTNGTLGSIGMTGDINGGLFRSDGTTAHTVLDTGNLTSYTYSSTASRTANTVLAAPNGSAGAATFRTLVTADLPASGATEGSYGPSANASPAHSGTFSVPYITINAKGQVTAASTKTITLPASGNTDTKVNVTLGTTTKAYLLGTSTTPTSTATGVTAIADTGVYLDTTAGKLTATTFAGSLSGNATSATRLVVGSVTVQTGSTKKAKITLETLMSWLITKGHIPSNTNCYRVINIGWQYASNDILQLTTTTAAGTTNYELQLAGVTIEFIGSATNYNTGVFRLRIHSSPTHDGFALTSGYNRFPVSHIAEYYCNGSAYSPTWKVLSSMGDDEAYKVTQSATTASNYRAILMGYNNSTDASTLTTTVTNQVYASSSIYAQPSTGTLYASKYNGYKVGGTPGNWFSLIPVIANDGVMEAGKYIDFHTTNTGTTDYDVRLTAGSGTLTCSGSITATSFSGNATSASKLATARTINGVSFDGSANIIIPRSTKHIHTAAGTNGSSGYVKIATIKVTANYADHPVEFVISQRNRGPYHLYVQFNGAASTDPTLYEFKHFDPANKGVNAYIVKSATSTWDIYIQKQQGYDHIYVLDVLKADGDEGACYSITYTNTLVSSVPTTNQTKSTATIQSHTHSYLPLSGGTVTGTTTFSQADYAGQLKINRASTATGVMSCIDYLVNNSRVGILGFDNNSKLYIRNANTSNMDMLTVDSSGNGTFNGYINAYKFNSPLVTSTHIAGNKGTAIINSSASAGSYTMLAKMNSKNGVFTHGVWNAQYILQYTANTTISAGTNTVTKSVTLLDESGNSSFPGTVTATSFSGNASSASKLATARTITLGSGLQGSVSFDGSANVTLNGSLKRCSFMDEASDWATYPWRKIANTAVGGSYADRSITFMVTNSWSTNTCIGILRAHIRVGGTAGVYETGQLKWLFLTDTAGTYIKPENFVMVYTNNSGSTLGVEIWVKNTARYNGYMFTVLDESHRTGFYNAWSLTTNPTRAASYTSGTGVIISSVSRVLNASQNMTYTELLYSGTGSDNVTGLENLSSYDLFTVIVQDSSAKWENAVVVTPNNYTRFCIPTSPSFNASSTFTGFVSIGIYVNTSSNGVTCYPSKYIIEANSSSSITASTHTRKYPITKVYGHKYYL